MEPALLIILCITLLAITVAVFVAIWLMLNAKLQLERSVEAVTKMSNDVSQLRSELAPLLKQSQELIENLKATSTTANNQLSSMSKGIDALSGMATDVRQLEQRLLQRVGPPLEDAASILAGVSKGIGAFVRVLTKR